VIQSLSSLATGIIIAFIYSWEFALFILGLAPFFIVASFLEMKLMAGFSGSEALEGAGQVSIQCNLCGSQELWHRPAPFTSSVVLNWRKFLPDKIFPRGNFGTSWGISFRWKIQG